MSFFEPFSLGLSLIVLFCIACALLLAHSVLLAIGLGLRLERGAAGLARFSASLCLAGPVAIALLTLFVVQDGMQQMMPMATTELGHAAVGAARAMNAWGIGGLALMGLGVLGPVGLAILRWRERRGDPHPDSVLRAAIFAGIFCAALGAAVLYRVHGTVTGFAALAGASETSRAEFLVMLLAELPSLSWLYVTLPAIALAGAFAVLSGRDHRRAPVSGRALLAVSLPVFLLGGLAFWATRGHAADRQDVLPAVLERLRAGDDLHLRPHMELVLPQLKNTRRAEKVPTIAVGADRIEVEGMPFEGGGLSTEGDPLVIALAGRLEEMQEMWRRLHPGEPDPHLALLQVDVGTPAPAVERVLKACRRAGRDTVQFVSSEKTAILSRILGPLELVTYRALFVDLVDEGSEGAEPWRGEKYGDLALRLDAAAKEGRVRLQVPGEAPAPVEERPPVGAPGGAQDGGE